MSGLGRGLSQCFEGLGVYCCAQLCLTLPSHGLKLMAPLSMEFSRQEHWNGLPVPSPGDLTNPGIDPRSPALQTDSLPSELSGKPMSDGREVHWYKFFGKLFGTTY